MTTMNFNKWRCINLKRHWYASARHCKIKARSAARKAKSTTATHNWKQQFPTQRSTTDGSKPACVNYKVRTDKLKSTVQHTTDIPENATDVSENAADIPEHDTDILEHATGCRETWHDLPATLIIPRTTCYRHAQPKCAMWPIPREISRRSPNFKLTLQD
jgi:hypothetical protein